MLCFDLMEMVGTQVELIRKNQEYKKNYNECINTLNSVCDRGDYNLFDWWVEWYQDADGWLSYLETNSCDDQGFPRICR